MGTKIRSLAFLEGVTTSYATTLLNLLLMFCTTPIILHGLGASKFGIWMMLLQVQGHLGLLDFGMATGSVRTMAESGGLAARPSVEILGTIVRLYGRIGILIFVIGGATACALPWFFPLEYVTKEELVLALGIMVSGSALLIPLSVSSDYLFASQRLGLLNGFSLIRAGIEALVSVILVVAGFGIVGLAIAQVTGAVVFYAASSMVLVRDYGWASLRVAPYDQETSRRLWFITRLTFVQKLSATLSRGSDGILIGFLANPAAVTVYVITQRLIQSALGIVSRAIPLLLPGLTQLWTIGGAAQCSTVYIRACRMAFVGLATTAFIAAAVDASFVRLWVGENQCGPTSLIWLTAAAGVMSAFGGLPLVLLTAANRLGAVVKASVLEAVLKIAIGIVLLKTMGLPGLALGGLVAWVASYGSASILEVSRVLGIRWQEIIRETVSAPAVIIAVPAVAVLGVGSAFSPASWPELISQTLGICLLMATAAYWLERQWGDLGHWWRVFRNR